MITAIVAHGQNFEIGRNNQLLCHLPGDLKRFKELTSGHIVVMGRKTWDSLPKKPLPNRTNLVVTAANRAKVLSEGAQIVLDLEETLKWVNDHRLTHSIFIIGGEQIYGHFLPLCDKLLISRFPGTYTDADAFFPRYEERFSLSEKTDCDGYSFETWI